jgi:hypothetical protein
LASRRPALLRLRHPRGSPGSRAEHADAVA